MPWIISVEIPDGKHEHIDVPDPTLAAIVIQTINDAVGHPLRYRIEQWCDAWVCEVCGAQRPDSLAVGGARYPTANMGPRRSGGAARVD